MRTARPDRAAEVTIERLGALGDGIAETELGPMYVPDALPGCLLYTSDAADDA